jgi:hypothetical protein
MRHISECVNEVLAELVAREHLATDRATALQAARAALVAAKGADGAQRESSEEIA